MRAVRESLEWIIKIADANYEQDATLRSRGARTLKRISDRARFTLRELEMEPVEMGFKASGRAKVELDLTELPEGQTYEDRYQGYLEIFKEIAGMHERMTVIVRSAPWCWVPLLEHLNCVIVEPRFAFQHCIVVAGALTKYPLPTPDRTTLEVLCSFRPETVDALWKIDMQWPTLPGRVRNYDTDARNSEFIVTTNGAFHRKEVLNYLGRLATYSPPKRRVILVPCAADKPYPAPMHKAVLSRMPASWYMMNVTGVVGLIPQDLWDVAPMYDSGIPNRWRVFEAVRSYFSKHEHEQIIVYCDFYSEAIKAALRDIGHDNRAHYILPVKFYADYVNLMQPELLDALTRKLQTFER